jgi:hypothetical protein
MADAILDGKDRQTITDVINWFARAGWDKFAAGVLHHGGVLVTKGGLLHEAEMECLDHAIYIRALRHQLAGIYDALVRGDTVDATQALRLVLYGKPTETLPGGVG